MININVIKLVNLIFKFKYFFKINEFKNYNLKKAIKIRLNPAKYVDRPNKCNN